MRFTITYTNYPLSPKLTNKSKRVATLTKPLYGISLGAFLGILCAMAFPNSITVPMIVMFGGMVAGPILLAQLRKKKFAQFDEEYQKILASQGR